MLLARRLFLATAALLPAAARARALPPLRRSPVTPGRTPDEVWDLWPGRPPGGESVAAWAGGELPPRPVLRGDIRGIARPVLAVWRPQAPTGGSLLLLPGGAYRLVSWDNEGTAVAQRLLPSGVTVFVLAYRLPGDGLGWADEADAPLADAQRALRLVRDDATRGGRDPADAGVLGFSAGGHLAGRLMTEFGRPAYAAVDERDRHCIRPAFAGLLYPVVTLKEPAANTNSRLALVGDDDIKAAALSLETLIGKGVPPTFLAHALDDDAVDPQNALLAFEALRRAQAVCEMHLFQEGMHGFGVTLPPVAPAAAWPEMFVAWARRNGGLGGVPSGSISTWVGHE